MERSKNYQENREMLISALEAVLFAAGDPVTFERIAEILSVNEQDALLLAQELKNELDGAGRAFELYLTAESAGLCTKGEYAEYVTKYLEIKRNIPLSRAALETLSIIAYQQPTTRGYVEKVRGVDCSSILNGLLERGLVEECGRLDAPGRPILYRTTPAFLRSFGLSSVEELPSLEDHLQLVLDEALEG